MGWLLMLLAKIPRVVNEFAKISGFMACREIFPAALAFIVKTHVWLLSTSKIRFWKFCYCLADLEKKSPSERIRWKCGNTGVLLCGFSRFSKFRFFTVMRSSAVLEEWLAKTREKVAESDIIIWLRQWILNMKWMRIVL